jgi:drug/metabolite transporter (DMT)-like permease
MSKNAVIQGIVIMVVAMLILPFVDAISKELSARYSVWQIIWVRQLVHASVILPLVLLLHRADLSSGILSRWHLLRGAAFLAMSVTYVISLKWMPLAEAISIIFLFPLIVTLISMFFLGETVGPWRLSAVIIGLIGVCLVIKPGLNLWNPGTPWALAAAALTASYILLTRKLSGTAPPLIMLFGPAFLGCIVLAPAQINNWTTPTSFNDLIVMLSVGALAALVHLMIILAYKKAESSLIAPFAYVQIIMNLVLGFCMFGNWPDHTSFIGIALILTAGFVVMIRESSRKHSYTRTPELT